MKAKRILTIVGGLIMGVVLILMGAKELVDSIHLEQRGKSTTAEVVSARDRVSGRLRSHSYYLTILFKDAAGASIRKEVKVSKAVYGVGQTTGSTKAFYLPERPEICAAGDTVDLRYGTLALGLLVIGAAGFLIATFNAPAKLEELAERIEQKLEPIMAPSHRYANAEPGDYKHLDLAFYDAGRRYLEERGYRLVGDRENVTLREASGIRTMLRLLLGGDQATQAFLYHFKAAGAGKETKVLDLQTSFTNGGFVCTSNAAYAGNLKSPPAVASLFIPGEDWAAVLENHQRRVTEHLAKNPGLECVRINGPEEFQRVMDALQSLKAEFRRQEGISQSELERISGKNGAQIQELAEILKRRWAERSGGRVSPVHAT